MALSTFVYIRDVENLSDARYCAGMGVDMIGFRLDSSLENALDTPKFTEISNWISGVKLVGEFGKTPQEKIKDIITNASVDYLLVTEISQLEAHAALEKPLILQIDIHRSIDDQLSALNYTTAEFDYLLLTSAQSSLNDVDKKIIKELSAQYPVLLGFGIDEQNAMKVIDELNLEGISLAGSSEIRPGFKDHDELADILEALEVD